MQSISAALLVVAAFTWLISSTATWLFDGLAYQEQQRLRWDAFSIVFLGGAAVVTIGSYAFLLYSMGATIAPSAAAQFSGATAQAVQAGLLLAALAVPFLFTARAASKVTALRTRTF